VKGLEVTLNKIGQEIVDTLTDNLQRDGKNASRNLSQSISFNAKVLPSKNGLAFGFKFQLLMDSYWYYVDKGRKPGKMPPIADIVDWIINKPIKPNNIVKPKVAKVSGANRLKNKKGSSGKINATKGANRIKGLAYVIARSIAKNGTKGSKFYSRYIDNKFLDTFISRVEDAMFENVEDAVLSIAEANITNVVIK